MTTNPPHPFPAERRPGPGARPKRWIAVLIATLVLHVVAFHWADGRLGMPSWRTQEPQVIVTELHPAPAPVAPPAAAAPKPKPKPRPRRRASPPPAPPAAEAMPSIAQEPASAVETAAEPGGDGISAAGEQAGAAQAQEAAQEPATTQYTFAPPPPAELSFDVEALQKGQTWHGSGMYRWQATDDSYAATIEVGVTIFFRITALNIKSEGRIADFGLAPVLYSEKPWRRPLMNTHFQHDNRKISFSASEAVYPYNGGEQDRASIVWQLAGLGRGDGGRFAPGADLDIVVAGTRDAEIWHFSVLGQEDIDTGLGRLHAWHVKRSPQPGSYDRTLDIWLAPQHEWYPVKVRYTEANGDYYDLSLTKIAPAATQ